MQMNGKVVPVRTIKAGRDGRCIASLIPNFGTRGG